MFADFLSKLTQPKPEPLAQTDARLALTALLVRLARSDGDYATAEKARIRTIVASKYALDEAGVDALMHQAETLETEAPDTVRFTRAIKDAVAYEDRLGIIEALWSVALVDGERDDEENALMRMVANFLGVSDRDSNIARQAVAKT
ncbi:MAG: TerB family tellurite resistance protein [Pseudomonadota bacterium]